MELYKAEDVRLVCPGVTVRMIDYWVEKDVVRPAKYVRTRAAGRTLYLFSFTEIVQIRIIKSLRDAGVSLQRIREIVPRLRDRRGGQWQSTWLVTDGREVFEFTNDPRIVESHAKGERGQFAFAVIALGQPEKRIKQALATRLPFDESSWAGPVLKWNGWGESKAQA